MEKRLPNRLGKYPCPCCRYYTLERSGHDTFEVCDVCNWENDAAQYQDRDLRQGRNRVSLNTARANFRKLGACDEVSIASVRKPTPDEMPDAPKKWS